MNRLKTMADEKPQADQNPSEKTEASTAESNAVGSVDESAQSAGNSEENKTSVFDSLPADAEELSPEQLEAALNESDPDFAKSLNEIESDLNSRDFDLEVLDLDRGEATVEEERWKNATGWRHAVYRVFPGIVKVASAYRKFAIKFKLFYRSWLEQTKKFLKNLPANIKAGIQIVSGYIGKKQTRFSNFFSRLSIVQKITFVGLILLVFMSIGLIYVTLKKGILPEEKDLFLGSFDSVASESKEISKEDILEPFYDSTRAAQNMMQIQKMVVNIMSSSRSGENPMFAFDLFVEGLSPDVVIEIKDREVEFKDAIQRAAEVMTFDLLDTADGKKLLLEQIKKELNSRLTTGRVRHVYYKTFILKP